MCCIREGANASVRAACVRACVRTLIRAFVRLFVVSFIYSFPGLVLFAKYLDGQRSNYFSSLVNALGYNLIKLIADGYRKRFYFLFCSIIFVINSFFSLIVLSAV